MFEPLPEIEFNDVPLTKPSLLQNAQKIDPADDYESLIVEPTQVQPQKASTGKESEFDKLLSSYQKRKRPLQRVADEMAELTKSLLDHGPQQPAASKQGKGASSSREHSRESKKHGQKQIEKVIIFYATHSNWPPAALPILFGSCLEISLWSGSRQEGQQVDPFDRGRQACLQVLDGGAVSQGEYSPMFLCMALRYPPTLVPILTVVIVVSDRATLVRFHTMSSPTRQSSKCKARKHVNSCFEAPVSRQINVLFRMTCQRYPVDFFIFPANVSMEKPVAFLIMPPCQKSSEKSYSRYAQETVAARHDMT